MSDVEVGKNTNHWYYKFKIDGDTIASTNSFDTKREAKSKGKQRLKEEKRKRSDEDYCVNCFIYESEIIGQIIGKYCTHCINENGGLP